MDRSRLEAGGRHVPLPTWGPDRVTQHGSWVCGTLEFQPSVDYMRPCLKQYGPHPTSHIWKLGMLFTYLLFVMPRVEPRVSSMLGKPTAMEPLARNHVLQGHGLRLLVASVSPVAKWEEQWLFCPPLTPG